MTDDRLGQLLHRADATAAPPLPMTDGLAPRVRAALARRCLRRRIGATLTTAAGVAVLVLLIPRSPQHSPVAPPADQPLANRTAPAPTDVDLSSDELNRLRRDADIRMALLSATRQNLRSDAASTIDPLLALRVEADSTASALLERATRLDRELGQRDVAIGRYREVLESFPASDAAAAARLRLNKLQRNDG